MSILKAIGYCALALILLLGLLVFIGVVAIAWPILIVLLIFGLPFILIGIVAGRKEHKD